MSPTQRTLAEIKKQGLRCGIVEKWVTIPNHPAGGQRFDFLGIIDIIALDPARGVVGIQSTGTAFSEHVLKLMGEGRQACIDWLSTPGAHLELWGWRKLKVKRGGKAMRWEMRKRVFHLGDFTAPLLSARLGLPMNPGAS